MERPRTYIKKCEASQELKDLINQKGALLYSYPSLDDWLIIVRENQKLQKISDLELLSKFRITIAKACCDKFLSTQTMYDLWIIFWMKFNFGKQWQNDGERWI